MVRRTWQYPDEYDQLGMTWVQVPLVSHAYCVYDGEVHSFFPSSIKKVWRDDYVQPVARASNVTLDAFRLALRGTNYGELYYFGIICCIRLGEPPRKVADDWGLNIGTLKVYCTKVRNALLFN